MEPRKPYAKTVDYTEKKKIWKLYFDYFFSYDELIRVFKNKYTIAQLKSIIKDWYDIHDDRERD